MQSLLFLDRCSIHLPGGNAQPRRGVIGKDFLMLKATRPQRTLAGIAEVRGVGFFRGADVSLRFHPGEPDTGIVFERCDLPDRPRVPALVANVVHTQRRTTIRRGGAAIEMIEHVMAALAGLQIDNCLVKIDASECPGCDGSSRVFVEALDRAGTIEQNCLRKALSVDHPLCVQDGDAILALYPDRSGRLTLTYHLDYGRNAIIPAQNFCIDLNPESFRDELAASRTFLLEAEAVALRTAGIGVRTTHADLLMFGKDGVIGNQLRYPDECVRHKILDMVGDLALLGLDLHAFVVAHRSGHHTNAMLGRKLVELAGIGGCGRDGPIRPREDGALDVEGIMSLLPHRYPFLLVDRVLELEPGRRVVAIKNVSVNEAFFQGHWPALPIMPGVLIVEAIAQAAGVLIASSVERDNRVALITTIDGVKLRRPVAPGDQLRLEITGHRLKKKSASVSGVARVGDAVAAEARLRFIIVDASRTARPFEGVALDYPLPTAAG
jgi:UDP-3-O-[3-hydroxymyristoyl] N-acetylglucosamine deacetylase/3-hydroxyacyl-[acyl-carrier-protein] dehydratase